MLRRIGFGLYGSVRDRVRSDCRQMMNLFGGQGLEEQEGFDSGVCVCVCVVLFHRVLRLRN